MTRNARRNREKKGTYLGKEIDVVVTGSNAYDVAEGRKRPTTGARVSPRLAQSSSQGPRVAKAARVRPRF